MTGAGARRWKIGVIGCGEWGPNHVRNFSSLPDSEVVAVADLREERLARMAEDFPAIARYRDAGELLARPDLDAVVVATPAKTHFAVVRAVIEAGKHVLCEKPLCHTVEDSETLVKLAHERHRLLMVGHVFLFNRGIRKLKEIVADRSLGRIFYLVSRRTGLGPIRRDVSALWDLAAHDVSIANFLLDAMPHEVSAVGQAYLQEGIDDLSFLTLHYPGDVIANIQVSWIDPKKVREITVVGQDRMACWNELVSPGPVTVFDTGIVRAPRQYVDYGEFQLLTREGDITIPRVVPEEPLRAQARAFLEALASGHVKDGDGRHAVDVTRVLDAATRSMAARGAPTEVR
ncbi:MAG: Gfo/Idh/MocA family oxidoreductase [Candidatus Rokubacteria bacterium]|nr:Gfo/Idh/MocA family oxidoreductase [Candidatus Rokubacteria bacterium]